MKQLGMGTGFEKYARATRREQFLAEMDRIVPWTELCARIAPHYPRAGDGRPLKDLEMMLRIYFRHLLERHGLGEKLFEQVRRHLQRQGFRISTGTIVDATVISVPSSTKNQKKERDPDMHQTRKGQRWYFGMEVGYRGLETNANCLFATFALANLYLGRRRLLRLAGAWRAGATRDAAPGQARWALSGDSMSAWAQPARL